MSDEGWPELERSNLYENLINETLVQLQELKQRHGDLRNIVNQESIGSILNGYREGDVLFNDAVAMLHTIGRQKLKDADIKGQVPAYRGMNLREWLAGQALAGAGQCRGGSAEGVADRCVEMADKVIERLKQDE